MRRDTGDVKRVGRRKGQQEGQRKGLSGRCPQVRRTCRNMDEVTSSTATPVIGEWVVSVVVSVALAASVA